MVRERIIEDTGEHTLGVFHLPPAHRQRMKSTNGLENFNGQIDRRTRVVRLFPDEPSCRRLVSAVAMEQWEPWLMGPRYLDMSLLDQGHSLTAAPDEVVMA
jgi:transposase-like protein